MSFNGLAKHADSMRFFLRILRTAGIYRSLFGYIVQNLIFSITCLKYRPLGGISAFLQIHYKNTGNRRGFS
ncbi:hypothetical protein BBV17_07005 [Cytobacillus oceanisediminis]|uniref:Uncharacterized protein n=1 Tax=Cytobacillus oceanisediminis TaxID=665099 RepID=A0ABX3CZW5_9BACI|nr:hypothetical protein BBV17_07005 [Cytobacillus oceanisediminis]